MAGRVPARLTAAQGRKFGLTLGIAFGVLGGITFWRDHITVSTVLWSVAGAFTLSGLLIPTRLGPVERGWMAFAEMISKVTTPIVMGIVYFLVVTPIGLLMRTFKGNPLTHKASADGYWARRDTPDQPVSDMTHQF